MEPFLLHLSVFFVGFIHSLSPGHWFPVLIVSKNHQWNLKKTLGAALVASSGHIMLSMLLGGLCLFFEKNVISEPYAEFFELFGHVFLIVFGLLYATFYYFQHAGCHGHTHHGPTPRSKKHPLIFLFFIGLSPCIAVLPLFANCWQLNFLEILWNISSFAIGVSLAFILSVSLGFLGLSKLDHPLLEHFGNVITGLSVAVIGCLLLLSHLLGLH